MNYTSLKTPYFMTINLFRHKNDFFVTIIIFVIVYILLCSYSDIVVTIIFYHNRLLMTKVEYFVMNSIVIIYLISCNVNS